MAMLHRAPALYVDGQEVESKGCIRYAVRPAGVGYAVTVEYHTATYRGLAQAKGHRGEADRTVTGVLWDGPAPPFKDHTA